MLRKLDHNNMGTSDLEWLKSRFHFSFAEYYNPKNIHFGRLRVINDDLVRANTGFAPHPHQNMEIISYVVDGKLTHQDSMGNKNTLSRGQVQYMSAGTGVVHSEYNFGEDTLRFLQIWILPDKNNYAPNYGDYIFPWEDRKNKWLLLVSEVRKKAPITIHQDVNIYVTELDKGKVLEFPVRKGRQAYLVQIEGNSKINDIDFMTRDGLEIVEEDIKIVAEETSHILVIEMNKE